MFEKGYEKFYDDFDISTFLKSVRRLESITEIVMNKNQKVLEKYSKFHLIDDGSIKSNTYQCDNIPSMRNAHLRQITHSSYVDDVVCYESSKPMSYTDYCLISNISNEIFEKQRDVDDGLHIVQSYEHDENLTALRVGANCYNKSMNSKNIDSVRKNF